MTDPTLIDQLKGLATGIATEVATKYTKPSGGIPDTDLDSGVQTSLGKADSALQTAPVTSVNAKSGAVNLSASDVGAAPTGAYVKPGAGVPSTDMTSAVQTSLGKADSALQTATNWNDIPGKPVVVAEGTSESAARTSIGAGTSNLVIGNTGTTALWGDYQPHALNISDSSMVGRELLTTANVATAQSILDVATAAAGVPTGGTTGQVLSKASGTDLDTEWTPPPPPPTVYAEAAGTGSNAARAFGAVTFPAGRFSVAPKIYVQILGGIAYIPLITAVTRTGFKAAGFDGGGSAGACSWNWHAVQMTSTSAAG